MSRVQESALGEGVIDVPIQVESSPFDTRTAKDVTGSEDEEYEGEEYEDEDEYEYEDEEYKDEDEDEYEYEDEATTDVEEGANVHHSEEQNAVFFSQEWGYISSMERHEAVMLEAAMFGVVPEGVRHFPQIMPWSAPRPPSASLAAQRLIREQQDEEYRAALQADMESELKAKEAAEAALAESRRRLQEEEETERQLAAKEAALPKEPTPDAENAITLLVRMPDGSKRGRRFHKSDELQHLFDFVDVGRGVRPGSYRLVRLYPRRVFSGEESSSMLSELGLTSKQEALYLESI
ncbi:hypothetical protein AAHA92_15928 [Salvia divinorum]|uniref:UBX domain-containing protein n=1 Tax=Salvia divinorum TaxID=28513 RepID=A0ABD1GTW0_SALDI